jgi:rod shape determining protein RodA
MSQIHARQRLYRRSRQSFFHGFDPVLTTVVGLLLFVGTLLVWAATRDWYTRNGLDGQYYLKRHIINILIGLVLAYAVTVIDYRLLRAYTPFLWGAGVLGLIIVLIPGLGAEVNGAKAWIALPGGFQIQPAELAKIAIIIGMSMILSERTHDSNGPTSTDVLQSLAVAAIPVLLIIVQPDMGTVLIISAAVVTIIAVSGAPARWVTALLLLAVLGGFVAVKAGVISEYQVNRLQTFVDPNADTQGAGYQLRQARITVGSGGLLGTGLFNGPQTSGRFVPEQQTDFIFTVAGEQLGFVGSGAILIYNFTIKQKP